MSSSSLSPMHRHTAPTKTWRFPACYIADALLDWQRCDWLRDWREVNALNDALGA
ncbi:uncharacterized protein BKA78DRAFT_323027 [Phyllosticta capitalensis]|uniref:uncharacterized protein n=1 Tax=Phyllosticta capitalensis TaxID=121624 RepID=UPI003131C4C8